jgi:hypothetical protein
VAPENSDGEIRQGQPHLRNLTTVGRAPSRIPAHLAAQSAGLVVAQTSQTVEDLQVRVYERSAVVAGKFTITGTYAGQPNNLSGQLYGRLDKAQSNMAVGMDAEHLQRAGRCPGPEPAGSFFIAKEKEDWEALKNRDKAAPARLLADDFVGMYDFGFFTKSEWIKQIDEEYTVDDYPIENARLLRPSAHTALLLYTSNC